MTNKLEQANYLERRLKMILLYFVGGLVSAIIVLYILFLPILREEYCFNQLGKGEYGRDFKEQLRCESETVIPWLL